MHVFQFIKHEMPENLLGIQTLSTLTTRSIQQHVTCPETTYHQGKPSQVIINSFKSGAFTESLNKQTKHLQPSKRKTQSSNFNR